MKIHERPVAAKPSCAENMRLPPRLNSKKRTADEQNETQRLDVGEYISRLVIDDGDEQREKAEKMPVMSKIKPTVRLILLTFIAAAHLQKMSLNCKTGCSRVVTTMTVSPS